MKEIPLLPELPYCSSDEYLFGLIIYQKSDLLLNDDDNK